MTREELEILQMLLVKRFNQLETEREQYASAIHWESDLRALEIASSIVTCDLEEMRAEAGEYDVKQVTAGAQSPACFCYAIHTIQTNTAYSSAVNNEQTITRLVRREMKVPYIDIPICNKYSYMLFYIM